MKQLIVLGLAILAVKVADFPHTAYVDTSSSSAYKAASKGQWFIVKDDDQYNLYEFIRAGLFCEVYGHQYPECFTYSKPSVCEGVKCVICGKCRPK